MSSPSGRSDPIRDEFYSGLEWTESASDWLFFVAAAVSLIVLVINRQSQPELYIVAELLLVILTTLGFASSLAVRLYFQPRALDARRTELISNAFGIALTHKKTVAYYNNNETEPLNRLGMSIFENTYFGKAIARQMLIEERIKAATYSVLWLLLALTRSVDLEWVVVAAQVVLSEQILSRWIRLEWARSRFEKIFDSLNRLFRSGSTNLDFQAQVLEAFGLYETGKSNIGISMSSRIFARLNPKLISEWEQIRKALNR